MIGTCPSVTVDQTRIRNDWASIDALVEKLKEVKEQHGKQRGKEKKKKPLVSFMPYGLLDRFDKFRRRGDGAKSRQRYPSLRIPRKKFPDASQKAETDSVKAARLFCRVVKTCEMLGSMTRLWGAMRDLKQEFPDHTIEFFSHVEGTAELGVSSDHLQALLHQLQK
jgi:hypothetical protein